MSTNTVTDRDLGYKNILGAFGDLAEGKHVVVGIRAAAGGEDVGDGFNLASLAAVHEFGTDKAGPGRNMVIPERSFLRSTVDAQKEAIADRMEGAVVKVLDGSSDVDRELGILGEMVAGAIKQAIADRTIGGPANAQATIDAKGSSTPLVDNGRLRQSIDSEVRSE